MKKVLIVVLTLLMVVSPLTQSTKCFAAEGDIKFSEKINELSKTEKVMQGLGNAVDVVTSLPVWKMIGVQDVKEFFKNMDMTSLKSWKEAVSCFPSISASVISATTIFAISGFCAHMGKKFGNTLSHNRLTKWIGRSVLANAGKKVGKVIATIFLAANLENIIKKASEDAVCSCKGCQTLDNVYNYAGILLKK